jgi:hypothetical protein
MNPSPIKSECGECPMVKTPPPNPIGNMVRLAEYPTLPVVIPSSETVSPEVSRVASTRQTCELSLDQSDHLLRGNRCPASSSESRGVSETTDKDNSESVEVCKSPPGVKLNSRSRSSPTIAVLQRNLSLRGRGAAHQIPIMSTVAPKRRLPTQQRR